MESYEKISREVQSLFDRYNAVEPKNNFSSISNCYSKSFEQLLTPKPGIKLPAWGKFTSALNGLREHEFSILCGPTGSGKTMLLVNLAAMIAEAGHVVHVAPVETGVDDFIHRLVGIHAGKEISAADGVSKDWLDDFLLKHKKQFFENKIIFSTYETRVNHWQLMCDIYNSYLTYGSTVFLLDNLNFMMEVTSARDSVSEMDRVIHDLVIFCKLLPIHIIMVMHPKKTEGGRIESEFDIKGSSTAVQEASNVMLWNRIADDMQVPAIHYKNKNFMRELKFCKIRKNGKFVGQRMYFLREHNSENLREIDL